jgi:hypothetical protein
MRSELHSKPVENQDWSRKKTNARKKKCDVRFVARKLARRIFSTVATVTFVRIARGAGRAEITT